MRHEIELRVAQSIEKVTEVLGLICVLAVIFFAGALVYRGLYALLGWNYPFQSIGEFLHLSQPHKKLEAWDRSFLFLAVAAGTGILAGALTDAALWLRKSPEVRRRERDERREAEQNSIEAKRRAAAERKAIRKPMSGWRRLWIVSSLLLGALAYAVAYEAYRTARVFLNYSGDNDAFWLAARSTRDLGNCVWATAKADHWIGSTYSVSCTNADPWLFAGLWAFVPAVVLASLGLTVRWVYRGFRPKRAD